MTSKSPNKLTKIRRSAAQWQAIMLAYEQSGLTQQAFCSNESLAPSTFYKWRQRLAAGKPVDAEEPMFIELGITTTYG